MPYTTGSAADMAAVKTALVNACTADGWTEQTDAGGKTVIDKNGIYVRIEAFSGTDDYLALLGRTSLDGGDAPNIVSMGPVGSSYFSIQFPVTYHAFTSTNEVYFIINWSDTYEFCAFGQSQQAGLPGTGNWVAATNGTNYPSYGDIEINSSGGGTTYSGSGRAPVALFWYRLRDASDVRNWWLHNGIDATYPWSPGDGDENQATTGISYLTGLIDTQPNDYNLESVLLPIRVYKVRPENKVSQVGELANARHIRIDNYNDEQVITLGTDNWMVFPYYKRDASARDGGDNIDHSGTFGWAILKE